MDKYDFEYICYMTKKAKEWLELDKDYALNWLKAIEEYAMERSLQPRGETLPSHEESTEHANK